MNQEQQDRVNSQKTARQVFAIISYLQFSIHLIAYFASFMKLIIIEGGGYYNFRILVFIGISIISILLFLASILLIKRSIRLSIKRLVWAYFFHAIVLAWSLFIVKVSYFM
ncbi:MULTISPECIES: hypothetical protein [Nostocales]|uniref:Uncharacterized protein n=3 Tax=Nostocales TaxID=1161 RepID=A0A0C1RMB9_9CYAN|nr:hypothetical protein [Tolypothrix bouteillei]KAF3887930.1 hypothetical protein DA73_0400022380 [Tolypothrix bouteillei VB521301]